MLRRRHAILALALLLALSVDLPAQSQGPSPSPAKPQTSSQDKTDKNQQNATHNQNSADETQILTIKIVGTKPNAADSANQNADASKNNSTDWWMFGATVGIGFIGLLQLIAFIKQAIYMHQSAAEMRNTTKAAEKVSQDQIAHSHHIERAYISGGGMRAMKIHSYSAQNTPIFVPGDDFEFHFNNYGKTAGTLYKSWVWICDESAIPAKPDYTFETWRDQISPGRESRGCLQTRRSQNFQNTGNLWAFLLPHDFRHLPLVGLHLSHQWPAANSEPIAAPNPAYIQEQDESCDDADPL